MTRTEKYQALQAYLTGLGKVAVAFSGGVDSTFLLKVAKDTLGDGVKAITVSSPYIPRWELAEAREAAAAMGVELEILEADVPEAIRHNPENRCYLCKREIFSRILERAADSGFLHVADGTNFDDMGDYRPGLQALRELAIKSPLLDCQLGKEEIRSLSKELGLGTWDKPPYACLLTRIPYGHELREEDFRKIEMAERFMMEEGFRAVRVRCHENLARIEVDRKDRSRLFDGVLLDRIAAKLKEFGFLYVTMDLEGYRTGSFNEARREETGKAGVEEGHE